MFESIGNQTAKTIADALPGVEQTIRDAVAAGVVLVRETIVPIVADVVSETLARVDAIDGARVVLSPSGKLTAQINITVDVPTFRFDVSMPLKPKESQS